jgi:hypothetical protein
VWLGTGNTLSATTGITVGASSSASLNIATDSPTLVIDYTGSSAVNNGMQQTYVVNWVYKYI